MCLEQPRGHSEAAEGYYRCPCDSPRAVWWNCAKRKPLLKHKKRKTCLTLCTQWCLVGAASSCGDVSLQPGRFCEGTWKINAPKKRTGILEEKPTATSNRKCNLEDLFSGKMMTPKHNYNATRGTASKSWQVRVSIHCIYGNIKLYS